MPGQSNDSSSTRVHLALTDVVESPVTVRAVFAGVIDFSNADWFTEYVLAVLADFRQPNVQVDLKGVQFVDAAGVRALLACHQRAAAVQRRFSIVNATAIVRQVIQIAGPGDSPLPPAPAHGRRCRDQ